MTCRVRSSVMCWVTRPETGGTMRQVGYDRGGRLHLITASYSPNVWVHTPRGDRFVEERTLTP